MPQQASVFFGDKAAIDMVAQNGPVRRVLSYQGLVDASATSVDYNSPAGKVWTAVQSTRTFVSGRRDPVDLVNGTTFFAYAGYDSGLNRTYYDRIAGSQPVSSLGLTDLGWVVSFDVSAPGPTLATVFSSSLFTLMQSRSVSIYGSEHGDRLVGFGLDDTLYGGAGVDTLYGGGGADVLHAESGIAGPAGSGSGPDDFVFGGADNDSVFGSSGRDSIRGGAGDDYLASNASLDDKADTIWGDAGNDFIFLGAGNDSAHGGDGNDTVNGSYGDDFLTGGKGNDTIIGGYNDLNTAIFETTRFENTWARFNRARRLDENRDWDEWAVAVTSPTEGVDTLEWVDIAQYTNGSHSLAQVAFVINRADDGTARGRIFIDGEEVTALTNLLDGMRYDTLLPLGTGNYSGHYRSGGKLGNRVELSGWSDGQGVIQDGNIQRTSVQIHIGQHNGNSESCFLFSGAFRKAFFDHLQGKVPDVDEMGLIGTAKGDASYYPVIPMIVYVNGAAPQTKLVGLDDQAARPQVGASPIKETVKFDLRGDTTAHDRKNMDVFFTVEAQRGTQRIEAEPGKVWNFVGGLGAQPQNSAVNYEKVWKEGKTDDGKDVYGVRVGANADVMKSVADFDVLISSKAPAKLHFKIVDLDLFSKRGDNQWHLYAISNSSLETAEIDRELYDTDGPNKSEGMLLRGVSEGSRTATITIGADTAIQQADADNPLDWL